MTSVLTPNVENIDAQGARTDSAPPALRAVDAEFGAQEEVFSAVANRGRSVRSIHWIERFLTRIDPLAGSGHYVCSWVGRDDVVSLECGRRLRDEDIGGPAQECQAIP